MLAFPNRRGAIYSKHQAICVPFEYLDFSDIVSRGCQLSNLAASADGDKKWVLCGSALSTEEKVNSPSFLFLICFYHTGLAEVLNFFSENVR